MATPTYDIYINKNCAPVVPLGGLILCMMTLTLRSDVSESYVHVMHENGRLKYTQCTSTSIQLEDITGKCMLLCVIHKKMTSLYL